MSELALYSNINTVESLKNAINTELTSAAVSFVRIGYLLKTARDTDILKDSYYADMYDFATAEFGLDKSQVSRFIRINDRFSVNGYSENLEERYEGFGSAKLSIMLTLPDEINEELSPEYSKSEINAIKSEYEAESKISDLEVMMEEKRDEPDEFIAMIIKELNDEHPDAARYLNDTMKIAANMGITVNDADIMEAYIPDGVGTYSIRIPGQGRFMVSMKPEGIAIVNMREPENKSPLTWQEFKDVLLEDMKVRDFPKEEKKPEKNKAKKVKPAKPKENPYVKEVREYHEREKVAPVQQEETAEIQNEDAPERLSEDDAEIVGQSTDNVAQEDKEDNPAAGTEKEATTAAGENLTSSQTDMLEWLDLIRRKVVPEDGSRPDWVSILDEIKTMERFVKQFTF